MEGRAEVARDDIGERGLAETGRTMEQHVIERFASPPRRLDGDLEVFDDGPLPDIVIKTGRPQRDGDDLFFDRLFRTDDRAARRSAAGFFTVNCWFARWHGLRYWARPCGRLPCALPRRRGARRCAISSQDIDRLPDRQRRAPDLVRQIV